jgi:hypothetical protein
LFSKSDRRIFPGRVWREQGQFRRSAGQCNSSTLHPEILSSKSNRHSCLASETVLGTRNLGEQEEILQSIFDSINFTGQFNSVVVGGRRLSFRNGLPTALWPNQVPLCILNGSITWPTTIVPNFLTTLVFGDHDWLAKEYLGAERLSQVYREAYRLVFARAMPSVLQTSAFEATQSRPGQRDYEIQTLRVVPAFAYTVEALLVFNAVVAAGLACLAFAECYLMLAHRQGIGTRKSEYQSREAKTTVYLDCGNIANWQNGAQLQMLSSSRAFPLPLSIYCCSMHS